MIENAMESATQVRLQKIIANAGLGSRRQAEQWIVDGKVSVNGQVVTRLGVTADPVKDTIKVRGRLLRDRSPKVYLILNKPPRRITTTHDDQDRPTVMELVKKVPHRVFPVGRLDFHTQGVLLFTNDGEVSEALLNPDTGVKRTYEVKVRGIVEPAALNRLRKGIPLDGKPTSPIEVEVIRETGKNTLLTMHLVEGKNRHIKRVCEKVGHPVIRLKRTHFAFLNLNGLPLGKYRFLAPREIRALIALARKKS